MARLLGFARPNEEMRELIEAAVQQLVQAGIIRDVYGVLHPAG
ncbi:hypothetical protein [Hymenobacter cellulosilyticus]|nr:hypothetical protein [Hymenobacter cellulosilyticus]